MSDPIVDRWRGTGLLQGLLSNDAEKLAYLLQRESDYLSREHGAAGSHLYTKRIVMLALPILRRVFGTTAIRRLVGDGIEYELSGQPVRPVMTGLGLPLDVISEPEIMFGSATGLDADIEIAMLIAMELTRFIDGRSLLVGEIPLEFRVADGNVQIYAQFEFAVQS